MAQVSNDAIICSDDTRPLLPAGECGVMVCLVGVPLVWTVLIAGMVSSCFELFRIAVAVAIMGGLAGSVSRLIWLYRQDMRQVTRA